MKTHNGLQAKVNGITFSDADIVNLDNWIPEGEYNPHRIRPWLLHDHGFAVAVVFAESLQDALDEACDAGKLDSWMVEEGDLEDYPDGEGITYLGNASEPFDIDGLDFLELDNPPASFVAQFNAMRERSAPMKYIIVGAPGAWEVWSASVLTGDRKDFIHTFHRIDAARRCANKLDMAAIKIEGGTQ